VNYRIDDRGHYINQSTISTINVITIIDVSSMSRKNQYTLQHDTSLDGRYEGIEDVRLFSHSNGTLYYNGNRGVNGGIYVEHGIINSDGTVKSGLLKKSGQHSVEKNWVLFEDGSGNLKCIYSWHPLVIGDINSKTGDFIVSNVLPTANIFNHFRGSTNGVNVDGEIWFLCHVVSYENRRFYYHVMIALDKNTFKIKRYTPFFTFDKMPVEYTLGMVYKNGSLTIGYSLLDRETKYTVVPKKWFEGMFQRIGF
jgi:hypothetical protein